MWRYVRLKKEGCELCRDALDLRRVVNYSIVRCSLDILAWTNKHSISN